MEDVLLDLSNNPFVAAFGEKIQYITDNKFIIFPGIMGIYAINYNFFNYIFIKTFQIIIASSVLFPIGAFFAMIFASQLKFELAQPIEDPPVKFEDTYPIDHIADDEITLDKLNNKIYVSSNTPDGTVFMRWNNYREGFEYWSDNTIKYQYLETVARKFVKTYRCKSFYIDRQKEFEKLKKLKEDQKKELEEKLKQQEENPNNNTQEDDGVFVKFKNVNENKKNKKNNETIVPIKANKYIHAGKIKDLDVFKMNKSITSDTKNSAFSFTDFKKMFKKN
tara:strand:- start:4 stop:837 length:834 start_codon:yes stop_codon:yes gene_type:complete